MPPKKRPGPKSKTQAEASPPARRPGPKSKTRPRETDADNGEAASGTSQPTYDPTQKVFRCRYCRRVFRLSRDLRQHKLDSHMEELTHLTEATVQQPDPEPETESEDPPPASRSQNQRPAASPRKSPAKKTRPSASTAHKTSKADKKKAPKHRSRNQLPLAINNPRVAQNGRVISNPSSSSG